MAMNNNKKREILWQNPDNPDEIICDGVMYGCDRDGKLVELTEKEQKMVNLLIGTMLTDPNTRQIYSFPSRKKKVKKNAVTKQKQKGEVVSLGQYAKIRSKNHKIKNQ